MSDTWDVEQHPAGRDANDIDPDGAAPSMTSEAGTPTLVAPSPATLDRFTGITPGDVEHVEHVEQSGQSPDSAARTWEGE